MGTYSLRYYEPSYLAGMVAGAMTKTDTIGYVSSFPLPAVLQIINGFTLGAQAMNPGVKVKVIEVNSWYDPGREREATDALYAQGVDIVAHVTDSSAPTLSAQRNGKLVIGFPLRPYEVRSGLPADSRDSRLGRVLHPSDQDRSRRHVDQRADLGSHGSWGSGYRTAWQDGAGRCRREGEKAPGGDRGGHVPSLLRTDQGPVWNRAGEGG